MRSNSPRRTLLGQSGSAKAACDANDIDGAGRNEPLGVVGIGDFPGGRDRRVETMRPDKGFDLRRKMRVRYRRIPDSRHAAIARITGVGIWHLPGSVNGVLELAAHRQ